MPRLSEQILFLMRWGKKYFPELGELLNKPYHYGSILPKNDRAVRRALTRLVLRGELVKRGKRGKAVYRLSKTGKNHLREIRPFLARETWDGKWRVVVFDIPERYRGIRAVLRRFLTTMGLVNFQRSLWITPFNINQEVKTFLHASQLSDMAFLMEVDEVYGIEPAELASRAWRLEALAKRYEKFAAECARVKRVTYQHRQTFARLVFSDPLLPNKLLPRDFPRATALKAFRDLVVKSNS